MIYILLLFILFVAFIVIIGAHEHGKTNKPSVGGDKNRDMKSETNMPRQCTNTYNYSGLIASIIVWSMGTNCVEF